MNELKDKAIQFQEYLELPAGSDPHDIIQRLEYLNVLIAQSGRCLAEAKYLQEQVVEESIKKVLADENYNMTASTLNTFVKSMAKEYNYLVNVFDRINSSATHQIDSLRSILSFKKTEMML